MVISAGNTEHVIMRLQPVFSDALTTLDLQPDQRQAQRQQLSQSEIVSVLRAASQIPCGKVGNVSRVRRSRISASLSRYAMRTYRPGPGRLRKDLGSCGCSASFRNKIVPLCFKGVLAFL